MFNLFLNSRVSERGNAILVFFFVLFVVAVVVVVLPMLGLGMGTVNELRSALG